jgi:hypothetical protein
MNFSAFYDRICDWCGSEYNWKQQGNRYYCGDKCQRHAVLAQQKIHKNTERERGHAAGQHKARVAGYRQRRTSHAQGKR